MTINSPPQRPEVAAGMAAARQKGVRLGRPRVGLPTSAQRIDELREQGLSLAVIAGTLDEEKVPTLSGRGSWSKSSVRYVLDRLEQQRSPASGTRSS
ncbi:hypothetical protein [Krasilnikovia sp. MM14-A1259]|uniref:hypothetical protein n=1 Tax=Krasilnikovia sp. MM14-A1259 TaxID=3373539 RepID=UPI00399D436F